MTSTTPTPMHRRSPDRAPVVVAVDGSDDSVEAVAWAAERAAEWGAPLHMIASVSGDFTIGSVPSWLGVSRVTAWRAGRDPDVTDVVRGGLVAVMADRGAQARLVVLPGSVRDPDSLALAEQVGCPVVVCRDDQPPSVVSTSAPGRTTLGSAVATGAGSHT